MTRGSGRGFSFRASGSNGRDRQCAAVGIRHLLLPPACAVLSACGGVQSMLDPRGPAAQSIANVSWAMFAGGTAILVLVMALALFAVLRAPKRRRGVSETTFIVAGGLAFPVVTLSVLLFYGVAQTGMLRAETADAPLRIEVIGNRWWWDVRYFDAQGKLLATDANEIHIPAGVAVPVAVGTRDVIHSFWVPNLAGKIDMIPRRMNHIRLEAAQPGHFRGQCAEYCGTQHALMAFLVVAHAPEEFERHMARLQGTPAAPADERALRGREAFLQRCAQCHTVRDVAQARDPGPDLTHVGARRTLGSGVLENNGANMRAWIANSQRLKPGNSMPDFAHLEEQEIDDIAAWLEGLR